MLSIIGCGDIGQRIVARVQHDKILASCRQTDNIGHLRALGVQPFILDLDHPVTDAGALSQLQGNAMIYTVAPQPQGETDKRSQRLIEFLQNANISPSNILLISTTAVYGDCQGRWIDENAPLQANTMRGHRRISAEQQWSVYADNHQLSITILRVPGIYAKSRLPLERIKQGNPVLRASECGYSNRIHADDLARICSEALALTAPRTILNVSDGRPGTLTCFYQTIARQHGLPELDEIDLEDARQQFSDQLLSYYLDSRRINNSAMLSTLNIKLLYPDFINGMRY